MDDEARAWHNAHPMPPSPSEDDRVAWHLEHAAHCGCREIPAQLRAQIEARGLQVPERRRPG